MAFIPLVAYAAVAAVGAAVTAVASISSGIAQQNAAEYNAQVDKNNAEQAQEAAGAQASVVEQQAAEKVAAQKAAYAASGVDVNTGTPVDVLTSTAASGKLDALTVRYGGQVRALGDQQAGTLAEYTGSQAAVAGDLGGASSLLQGAGQVQRAGGWGVPATGSPAAPAAGTPAAPAAQGT
jgi:hypothetical protein